MKRLGTIILAAVLGSSLAAAAQAQDTKKEEPKAAQSETGAKPAAPEKADEVIDIEEKAEGRDTKPPEMVETDKGAQTEKGAENEDGKWVLPDGSLTYHVDAEGGIDWYAYNGYRRYHSECHVCHGPDGAGSTYAPALTDSMKTMSYADFLTVVASGRVTNKGGTEFVMPALGDNKNVMCYIDDLYVYLKARADGAIPRGRPNARKRAPKPDAAKEYEKACFG